MGAPFRKGFITLQQLNLLYAIFSKLLEILDDILYNRNKQKEGEVMDLLIVPVPLFNKNIGVEAYYFRHQKGNDIIAASNTTSTFDGAMNSPVLETLNAVGIEAFTMGKPIFVPISRMMLIANLDQQCKQPPDKVVFVLDNELRLEQDYLNSIMRLKALGFRFAIQKIENADAYEPALALCDFVYLDNRRMGTPGMNSFVQQIGQRFRHLTLIVTHINTVEIFRSLASSSVVLFEGRFYRTPITKGENKVSPLQANLIKLLNLVRDENFEFDSVATIIQRDTALTVSLMRLVNSPYIGVRQKVKTINHAVTMLGQQEVRKWVTTAVSKLLGTDKPDEITKLSLMRARFAESLAPKFGLEDQAQSVFLMGLFSVMDVILEKPMEEVLEMIQVDDPIRDALISQSGPYYPVYKFVLGYEGADWKTVSRELIINDLTTEDIYEAYTNALLWYRDLLND